jgi:GNAT superfamily N-acetyltransferase
MSSSPPSRRACASWRAAKSACWWCKVLRRAAGWGRLTLSADGEAGPLLACGTLLLERKLIRGCGVCGHVEDVVVDSAARGRGVGRLLLDALVALARAEGCYKVGRRAAAAGARR